MDNILVIGAGGVSHVTVHKMAQNPNYFKNIILASRSIEKCFHIKESVKGFFYETITFQAVLQIPKVHVYFSTSHCTDAH